MQKKKKQHYVWKEYLRNWSKGESINCYIKSENKIIRTNLINTSQENYFYKIPKFSFEEISEIIDIAKDHSNEILFPQILKIIFGLYQITELHNIFKEDNESLNLVEKIKSNTIEDLLTQIEDLGKSFLQIDSADELSKMLSDKDLYSIFFIFISFQYVRTKKMKSILITAINENQFYKEKYWLIFQIIYGFEISFILSINQDVSVKILENNTELGFITSDQPIFNLKLNNKDEKGYAKDLELYFPLNKKLAIVVCRGKKGILEINNIDRNTVQNLNFKMFKNSLNNIYFDKEEEIRNCS